MSENDEQIRSPYNAAEPLKVLIERLNDCADFAAAARNPVSNTQHVCIAYGLVAEMG